MKKSGVLIWIYFASLFIGVSSLAKPLSGTYTIDKSGKGDYKSFRLAVNDLNTLGVSGPVIFNVVKGIYNESIEIDSVPGASSINSIVFQSKGLDSTEVTLDTSVISKIIDSAYVLKFNHAAYINFRKMTISDFGGGSSKTGMCIVVYITGNSHHITIENNRVFTNTDDSIFGAAWHTNGICIDDLSAVPDSFITIRSNHISGGIIGILAGSGIKYQIENSLIINHNLIDNFYATGIEAIDENKLEISENRIFATGWEREGILVGYDTTYGTTDSSYIINNFIIENGNWRGDALIVENANGCNIYNNTFLSDVQLSGNSPGHIMHLVNNIIAGIYIFTNVRSDFNDFYRNGYTFGGQWQMYPYVIYDLKTWQTISKQDKHSYFGNPNLVSPSTGNLHATDSSLLISNTGVHLYLPRNDIDGQTRNICNPDIGADEFPSVNNDVGISDILMPTNVSCGDSSTRIQVKVSNWGKKGQANNFNLHFITGGGRIDTLLIPFKGKLISQHDTIITIHYSPPLNTLKGGIYTFSAYTDLSTDLVKCNNSLNVTDSFATVPLAGFSISGSSFCPGDSIHIKDTSKAIGKLNYYYSLRTQNDSLLDTSSRQNPVFVYSFPGLYRIKQQVTTSSGCIDTISTSVRINALPDARFSYIKSIGFASFLAADTSLSKYTWDFGDKDSGSGYKPVHKYTANGKYTVNLITSSSSGCTASRKDTLSIIVTDINKAGSKMGNGGINVFPNPAKEETTVQFIEPFTGLIKLYSVEGEPVFSRQLKNTTQEIIDLHFLAKGSYFIEIMDAGGRLYQSLRVSHL